MKGQTASRLYMSGELYERRFGKKGSPDLALCHPWTTITNARESRKNLVPSFWIRGEVKFRLFTNGKRVMHSKTETAIFSRGSAKT
jgi:hypothetical protein